MCPWFTPISENVRDFLDYSPETGAFKWKIKPASKADIGDVAGYVSKIGYVYITIKEIKYLGHRLAWLCMTGDWPVCGLDHINGIKHDNRWENLREATQPENTRNRRINSNNLSGVMGVGKTRSGKWTVSIGLKGKPKYLGTYDNFFDAVCARKSAENKYGFHKNHGKRREK